MQVRRESLAAQKQVIDRSRRIKNKALLDRSPYAEKGVASAPRCYRRDIAREGRRKRSKTLAFATRARQQPWTTHNRGQQPRGETNTRHQWLAHLENQAFQRIRSPLGHLGEVASSQHSQRLQARNPHALRFVSVRSLRQDSSRMDGRCRSRFVRKCVLVFGCPKDVTSRETSSCRIG